MSEFLCRSYGIQRCREWEKKRKKEGGRERRRKWRDRQEKRVCCFLHSISAWAWSRCISLEQSIPYKWCHKLYPADLAKGLPKLSIQSADLWPLLGRDLFLGISGVMSIQGETSRLVGKFPGPHRASLGSRGHTERGKALNVFMCSFFLFCLHSFSKSPLKWHVLVKPNVLNRENIVCF